MGENKVRGASRLTRLINLNEFPINLVLKILLKDRTTGENIIWATDTYAHLGNTYHPSATIRYKDVVQLNTNVIQPRVYKALEEQKSRTKASAEVFTPSWICCLMNNHIDDVWFGRQDVFNKMNGQSWRATNRKIVFQQSGSKTWQNYVDSRRIEITCGEAPYLVSRYDATTGKIIPISHRIGILDRKLRVVNENAETESEWIKWTLRAYQSTYGYEYQGDNLLIARINLLMTFYDYIQARWNRNPSEDELKSVAHILSWNIWQMNGLTNRSSYDAKADRRRLQKIINDCDKIISRYESEIKAYDENLIEEQYMDEMSIGINGRTAFSIDELIELVKKESLLNLAHMYAECNNLFIIDEDDRDYAAELEELNEDIERKYQEAKLLRSETYDKKCKIADAPYCLIRNWRMRRTEYFRDIAQKSKGKGIMKFDYCIGNPPYQGANHQQIYTDFYLGGRCVANCVEMIFPIGWQEPKTANNLSKLNKQEIKADKQIVFIDNRQNVFPGISGAEWTNILLWRKGYDNGLNGEQLIYTNGENPTQQKLIWDKSDMAKPKEIVQLAEIVMRTNGFAPMTEKTSVLKPYGLRTDVFDPRDKDGNPVTVMQKYGLPELQLEKEKDDDLKVLGLYNRKLSCRYVPKDYPFSKKTDCIDKYKVFVPYAWGNMSETAGLGGAYANIIIASPSEICTEVFQESGQFDDVETAAKHAKYMMTKFFRALLFMNKHSQHSTTAYGAVPIQDFSEDWWDKSIAEIDDYLFEKYNIPENIKKFVKENIQTRTEANIINF